MKDRGNFVLLRSQLLDSGVNQTVKNLTRRVGGARTSDSLENSSIMFFF